MTSPAEYEAALCQLLLEEDPLDIRQFNVNIREERWTHFSLEGVKFPAVAVDIIQRGEASAIFERDLIIHFQQVSRAAALTNLNLPTKAWKSARLLGAVPNCRLVLMLDYHMLSPALSAKEAGLMTYLQALPDAGPSVSQVTSGLQSWKCAGRRLVEIGGRWPTATQLRQSFVKILS